MAKLSSSALSLVGFLIVSCNGVTAADKKPEAFQASFDGNVSVFEPIYSVPPGKRAEIEFLSIRVIHSPAPSSQAGGIYLRVVTTFAGELAEHTLPLVELTDQHRVGSHKVLLHADPDTDVLLQPTGGCSGAQISCSVRVSITGYLYDE
jgi:hypothetical protein